MRFEPTRLVLVSGSDVDPLTLTEAKTHLKVEDTSDDSVITDLIGAATGACEQFTGLSLCQQTWKLYLDRWPGRDEPLWEGIREGADLCAFVRSLDLPRSPLVSVTHVKTYDDADTATVYASTNYYVDTASTPGRLVIRDGASVPCPTRVANGIEIQFVAGYAQLTASPETFDVPKDLVAGIKRMIAHLYENRGDDPDKAMKDCGAAALWSGHRVHSL